MNLKIFRFFTKCGVCFVVYDCIERDGQCFVNVTLFTSYIVTSVYKMITNLSNNYIYGGQLNMIKLNDRKKK